MDNLETAIERWNQFLLIAPDETIELINMHMDLAQQLKEARAEGSEEVIAQTCPRERWQILSEIRPVTDDNDGDSENILADLNYDFVSHRSKYSEQQLEMMENGFISTQKRILGESEEEQTNQIPIKLIKY
jgi:hypothetical protein